MVTRAETVKLGRESLDPAAHHALLMMGNVQGSHAHWGFITNKWKVRCLKRSREGPENEESSGENGKKKKNPEFGRERNILGICQKSRDRHETRGAWKEKRGRRPREVNSLLLKSTNHCRSLLEELAVLRLFWEDLDSIHSVAAGWQPRAFYSTHPNAPSWVFPNVSCTWTKLAVIDTFRESAL